MSKKFTLQSEGQWSEIFENRSEHDSYDEAVEAAGKLFDCGDEGDFRVVESYTGESWRMTGHTLLKCHCPKCGTEIRNRYVVRAYDRTGTLSFCGCRDCYDHIMSGQAVPAHHLENAGLE